VAIVDYGLGNLRSVLQACEAVGLPARITDSPAELRAAPAAILPGVGAFGDAIAVLEDSGLADALREIVRDEKPLFGICLGFQLLLSESREFGRHRGLDFIPGAVVRLDQGGNGWQGGVKIPQVGWNQVWKRKPDAANRRTATPLDAVDDGDCMYFVHSFMVVPADPGLVVSTTHYGGIEFCSAAARGPVFGCQFHPERSGPSGLRMYSRFADLLGKRGARPRPAAESEQARLAAASSI
jgi:glutamine amidotransferase